MLTKVSRRTFYKKYPDFVRSDNYHNKYFYPEMVGNYILYADAGSAQGLCSRVAAGLTSLVTTLGYEHLNFMGDSSYPWLHREHSYPPVKRALQYLADNNVSKTFNGALSVAIADLPQFTRHLFWLVRCNGVVFYPHFSDPGFNIMANICQYGNIHISTLNQVTDVLFNDAMAHVKLSFLEGNNCGGEKIPARTFA